MTDSEKPITIDIRPAKRRFSKRKQWRFDITGANGEPIHPNDTYANVRDITSMLLALRHRPVVVRVHYAEGVQVSHWVAS